MAQKIFELKIIDHRHNNTYEIIGSEKIIQAYFKKIIPLKQFRKDINFICSNNNYNENISIYDEKYQIDRINVYSRLKKKPYLNNHGENIVEKRNIQRKNTINIKRDIKYLIKLFNIFVLDLTHNNVLKRKITDLIIGNIDIFNTPENIKLNLKLPPIKGVDHKSKITLYLTNQTLDRIEINYDDIVLKDNLQTYKLVKELALNPKIYYSERKETVIKQKLENFIDDFKLIIENINKISEEIEVKKL